MKEQKIGLADSAFSVPTVRRRTIAGVQYSIYHNDDRPVENELLGLGIDTIDMNAMCAYPDAEIAFICRLYLEQYTGRNYDNFYNLRDVPKAIVHKPSLKKIVMRAKQEYKTRQVHAWNRRQKGIYPLEIIAIRHRLKVLRYTIAILRHATLSTMPGDLSMSLIYLVEPLKSQAIIRIWQDYEARIGMPLQSIDFVYAGVRYAYRKSFNNSLHITWENVA